MCWRLLAVKVWRLWLASQLTLICCESLRHIGSAELLHWQIKNGVCNADACYAVQALLLCAA